MKTKGEFFLMANVAVKANAIYTPEQYNTDGGGGGPDGRHAGARHRLLSGRLRHGAPGEVTKDQDATAASGTVLDRAR